MDIYRPSNFDEYIGQKETIKLIKLTLKAAQLERRPIPNILLIGPWGNGKSVLASLILRELGQSGTLVEAGVINVSPIPTGYVGIDEIHGLKPDKTDSLNTLLDAQQVHIIGTTTDPGLLSPAFRSRFRVFTLEPYSLNEVVMMLRKICIKKNVLPDTLALREVALRGRINPRQSINFLSLIFDVLTVENKYLTKYQVEKVFDQLDIDKNGFTRQDRTYVEELSYTKPTGLAQLSSVLGVDKLTIENDMEPYLIAKKVIQRTPRGRVKLRDI
jgi:holliday junction DNA helicase RuvB